MPIRVVYRDCQEDANGLAFPTAVPALGPLGAWLVALAMTGLAITVLSRTARAASPLRR